MAWAWNKAASRYQNVETGQFMARKEVLGYVEKSITASGQATDILASYVADGLLAPGDFYSLMAREIKGEYVRQYLLGRGGRAQMTQADWGSIGGMLKEQYNPHLKNFAEQIAQGKLSEAQIRARAQMYVNSAREAFERAQARSAKIAGLDEVKWVLNFTAEHCPDCEIFSDMGWQRVDEDPYDGAYPGSGNTVCLTSCKCHLEYRAPQVIE